MVRNKIYAIVEGHGEAKPPTPGQLPAVYVLMNKLLLDLHCWTLFPAIKAVPWRMFSSGDFFAKGKLEQIIRAHKKEQDCAAILVLLDLDDDCPAEKGPKIAERIRTMEELPFSVAVVCAKCEYEAWFLASLESIHPGNSYPDNPEEIRAAKGWLKRKFAYREARDQSRYTQAIDIETAWMRSRSFQRLYRAFEQIVEAHQNGKPVITP